MVFTRSDGGRTLRSSSIKNTKQPLELVDSISRIPYLRNSSNFDESASSSNQGKRLSFRRMSINEKRISWGSANHKSVADAGGGKITNRRKTIHHSLKQDDEITFEIQPRESSETVGNSTKQDVGQPAAGVQQKIDVPTKNDDLIRKVAFLKVSVNYMLLSLGRKAIDYDKHPNFESWVKEYQKYNIKK